MDNTQILPLSEKDLPELVTFCDREIGKNYYDVMALTEALAKSKKNGMNSSLIAYSPEHEILGIRLTFAPGNWIGDSTSGLSPDLWTVAPEHLGCFKSLFIDARHQQKGLGKRLSLMSIDILKKQGAKAVLCHSSLNSPNNSSQKYLQSMGFVPLRVHPKYWEHIDYYCTHCHQRPCHCSALEMILYL